MEVAEALVCILMVGCVVVILWGLSNWNKR